MIQDIEPNKYDSTYGNFKVRNDDYIVAFKENNVILIKDSDEKRIPKYKEVMRVLGGVEHLTYMFTIDEKRFFLSLNADDKENEIFVRETIQVFRTMKPQWMAFAGFTSYHLYMWYDSNRYCGRCGSNMKHSEKERALECTKCNNIRYPRISPGVIVGIIDNDKMLLTRYARGPYKNYALVAGYNEIGESLEETVRREVMEEVGVKVKNIRYYKSQPWGLSGSVLSGFFADLDGDSKITLDQDELAEAVWLKREEIPEPELRISLTKEMIEMFKKGEI
ncbi:NADH pyrophosphatase [uncultured Clostridium sp.]|uniref:NAD(+) diphosphatase n=1 Tax=uncultured Clostridium sp. TaxID=59620 RepID=UPI000822F6B1|nr:NAD(+) diphosphatase [uncultured Clostridium sp.]SCJ06836.1 NADH pyrophosphatase [uncultured Clostridium sp.]